MYYSNGSSTEWTNESMEDLGDRRTTQRMPSAASSRQSVSGHSRSICAWMLQALAVGIAAIVLTNFLVWYVMATREFESMRLESMSMDTLKACIIAPANVLKFSSLPPDFEPSDAVVDPFKQLLYVVSDDGTLATFTLDGELMHTKLLSLPLSASDVEGASLNRSSVLPGPYPSSDKQPRADLEGLTLIPHRPGYLYLGNEHPSAILEYSIAHERVSRVFPLGGVTGTHKSRGIEALVYVPEPRRSDRGFFYVARQKDAQIFVFDVPPLLGDEQVDQSSRPLNLTYRGTFAPPGPGSDLSALLYVPEKLFAVHDKPQQVVEIDLLDRRIAINPDIFMTADLSTVQPTYFKTQLRGIEALAFYRHSNGTLNVYLGIDWNGHSRRLLRHSCLH